MRARREVQVSTVASRGATKSRPKAAFARTLSEDLSICLAQAEKLDPQPQVVVAFGFLITN
jgi:hypothetical protein